MQDTFTYYVIAPIDGLHLKFDYRMYSAEIYGSPPDYTPYPDACPEFRQPYEYLGEFTFSEYKFLSKGILGAYEVQDFYDASVYDILSQDKLN